MQLTGTVTRVRDFQQVTEKFSKQELIIEVQDGDYKNIFCIEFINDKVKLLEGVTVGQELTVDTNVRCNHNENSDRYFTSVRAWKIDTCEQPPVAENSEQYEDDLPF